MCEYEDHFWVSYDHFRDFVLSMGFPIYPLPLSDKLPNLRSRHAYDPKSSEKHGKLSFRN